MEYKYEYKINYSKRAMTNLVSIVKYIADDNRKAALKFYKEITNKILEVLGTNPYVCDFPPEEALRYKGKRRMIFGNYKIFYSIDENQKWVKIATIRHSARKP